MIKVKKYSYGPHQQEVVKEGTHLLKSAFKIYFLGILIYNTLDLR